MRDTQREAEAEAKGEAGSLQGAGGGTRSQDPRITPEPKAEAQSLSHPDAPHPLFFNNQKFVPFDFLHSFHSSNPHFWKSSVCSLYLRAWLFWVRLYTQVRSNSICFSLTYFIQHKASRPIHVVAKRKILFVFTAE